MVQAFSHIRESDQHSRGQHLLVTGGSWCDITVPNVHASTEDKSDDTVSPLINFALEYVTRKVQGNQEGQELDGTH
jgi:hypothetical protein